MRHVTVIAYFAAFITTLSACSVGPDYVRPRVAVPASYKEAGNKGWRLAQPNDAIDRGRWWEVFNNPELNALVQRVNVSNQNIAVAIAQYQQAVALVGEAQAAAVPTIGATASVTRQKFSTTGASNSSFNSGISSDYQGTLLASWEPDLWGLVRRQVESSKASAQASAAQLASVRLSMQATLAQDYYQLRTADHDQKVLDDAVTAYKKALKLTTQRFAAGVAAESDVIQADTQLRTAQAQAIENRITRAQLEHAIAVLVGVPPANFSIPPKLISMIPPSIPLQVPCALLERRPDVAEAERQMAAANAQIGVAIAAYFPTLTLSPTGGYESSNLAKLFTQPALFWSVGPQLAETLFDGGLRASTTAAARAAYEQSVANYRQTVLAAFQDVEDNLAAQRLLVAEVRAQKKARDEAYRALHIVLNNYTAGVAAYTDVIVEQNIAYTADKTYQDVAGRQMTTAVGLIKALGGGWHGLSSNYLVAQ